MKTLRSPLPFLAFILVCAAIPAHTQPTEQYSHGDPSDDEQYMLELMNNARANPAAAGIQVIDTDDPEVQQAYTYWQIDRQATKQAFTAYPSRPPLAFHPSLLLASEKHTADMIANNFQGHVGSDGSQISDRFARENYYPQGMYGENVSAYSNSVWYGYAGFIVDWGEQNQIELGHRRNILNFDTDVYTEVGLGIIYSGGGLQQGTTGPYVITQDFSIRSVRYIVGVCYSDQNFNGIYDPGEGIAGVRVMPSRGQYYAVTSSSGGYAIPFSGSGSVTITASGGVLNGNIVKDITFEGDNYKVDFIPSAQVPGTVVLRTPINNATRIIRTLITFEWQPVQFANRYEVQIASLGSFTPQALVFKDTLTGTTITSSVPACGTKYFWRVRAINDAGAGAWSVVFSFTTDGKNPPSPTLVGPKGAVSADFDKSLTFRWNSVNDATSYYIRFSTQANMNSPFFEDSLIVGNSYDLPVSSIPSGVGFFWAVRSANECGNSIWSAVAQVTPTITSVAEGPLRGTLLHIYPNPITDGSGAVVESPTSGEAEIMIISAAGQLMQRFNTILNNQEYYLSSDVFSVLPSGLYNLRISTTNSIYNTLFVKQQ
ncbi:MAG: T9SS type A sorting domain-containing protein [Ignavibacteria bacterium]|nr:T9SS type A sorting domain-containing protein [Ignavibacteria bacterium]